MPHNPDTRPSLLLTGFDPFDRFKRNPSFDALALAHAEGWFQGLPVRVVVAQLPVVFDTAFLRFAHEVDEAEPIAAVSFGVHFGGQSRYRDGVFYAEGTARNFTEPTRADNQGKIRTQPPVPGGPATLAASLPMGDVVQRLRAAGFEAELSDNAGNFLCNHIFYTGMHAYGARFPYGFVHVPPTQEHGGTLSLERLAKGMTVIATVVADYALHSRIA